ncbi:MAG: RagB/SusD family nutrient uptake outer membrane protein, partial [Dysgonamonadaceae bacterium]|nr:RagB/SusD family nutrient uptake outer membrane protein [Dysgonamonadaceae bacterium]
AGYVVNGVYASLQGFGALKSSTAGLILYSGDDLSSTSVSPSSNSAGVWMNRIFTASNKYVESAWYAFYSTINKSNSAREAVAGVPAISDAFKSRIAGEMYFVRAFCYYYLVRLWGGVPLRNEATQAGDFYYPRKSVDEVYAQIFADFKEASEKCLPFGKQPGDEFGRATKGAAQAMLAQAYLTYGNYCDLNNRSAEAQTYYREAVNWADSVLLSGEYYLLPNYADLYDVKREKNAYNEVIYGIQFSRDATAATANAKGSEWAYYTQPTTRRDICGNYAEGKHGQGSAQIRVQPWFAEQYFMGEYEGDYRAEVSFLTRWQGYSSDTATVLRTYVTFPIITSEAGVSRQTQPYLDKYRDPDGYDYRNHENDLFVIRLSEVWLIKAEALNELGSQTEAYVAFNKVRERARLADGSPRTTPVDLQPGLTKEQFRMSVFNERGLELVGEGQRFFDCVRTRYKSTNMCMLQWRMEIYYPTIPANQKSMPVWRNSKWEGGRIQMLNVSEWNKRFLLYPIPSKELDSNPNFGQQNPGW